MTDPILVANLLPVTLLATLLGMGLAVSLFLTPDPVRRLSRLNWLLGLLFVIAGLKVVLACLGFWPILITLPLTVIWGLAVWLYRRYLQNALSDPSDG